MTPNTFSVQFIIRTDRLDKKGYVPIYARIVLNGEKYRLSTNHTIRPHDWLADKQQAKQNTDNFKVINEAIEAYKSKIYQAYSKIVASGEELTMDNLKEAFYGKREKRHGLLQIAEEHNKRMSATINVKYRSSTYQKYKTSVAYLTEFIKYQYNKNDLPLKDVNFKFCELFFEFITTQKPCKGNGANKHIQRLKTIINYAIKQEYISVNATRGYTVSYKPVYRAALTQEEIKMIETLKLNRATLILVKDMFLLQVYTGLSYADVKAITKKNIHTINGEQWIKMQRQKTDIQFAVPLLAPALKLLEKYFNNADTLPIISNQKMNENLKIIQELACISKNLHCHLARHTFATTITLANGVPIDTVSKMLGHTKLATTQIYAKTLDNKIEADMQGLKDKFNRGSH